MRVISESKLKQFWEIHSDAKNSLKTWYKIVKDAQWQNTAEVRETWNSVDFVQNFTVFNFKKKYRLIAYIDYESGIVFIRNVLTHSEYDTNKWKEDEWFK